MLTSALVLREPTLEYHPLAPLRRLEPARPVSVLSERTALRWRHGERLGDVIEEACRRHADRTAVSAENADMSYSELDARANRMARLFVARGVRPGDRVAVLIDRGVEAYVTLFALLKAGAAYVPLDPNHPPERIRFILSDSGLPRFVGWKLGLGDETGSNFGSEQGQHNPFLCSVGANTVASDSLFLGNVTMSSHAFRLGACRLGERNFLGTSVYVPPGVRTGDNVLFATKVMAPIDGPLRENVGLLGSPAFEIPRAASRDLEILAAISPHERARRLTRKTWLNVASIAGLIASRWLIAFLAVYVVSWTAYVYGAAEIPAMTVAAGVLAGLTIAVFILIERASIGFGRLKPAIATVYDPAFWRVERHWKLSDTPLATAFAGTPMRNAISRLLGVKVGRRTFDDGCILSERTLVEIGDEANLNAHSIVQAHSLEEGVFKSDVVRIGAAASVGVGALVHYGVTMGEGTHLDADAFLMKGEITPAGSRWRGNPAKLVCRRPH